MDQATERRTNRNEADLRRLGLAVTQVARTLYVVPAALAALALAVPVADLRVGDETTETKTLVGLVGEFSDLESAVGVRPVVVAALAALVVALVAGLVTAGGRSDDETLDRVSSVVLSVAGAATMALTLTLPTLLGSADHVAAREGARDGPFAVRGSGIAFLLLAGIVAVPVAQGHRRVRD